MRVHRIPADAQPGTDGVNVVSLADEAEHFHGACLGLIRLAKVYGQERLEGASERALCVGALSYKSVESMLKRGLDRQPLLPKTEPRSVEHENVRGPGYYH